MIRDDPDLRDTYIMFLTARSEEYSEIAPPSKSGPTTTLPSPLSPAP